MKDVTSTSFGLVIAFLLPGMVGLFAVSFWFPALSNLFITFSKIESNLGLFFMVILASVAVGLELTVIRWGLFEILLCRKFRLRAEDFANLNSEKNLESFRACVDEHYRYHQFWGEMSVNIPILYAGWIRSLSENTEEHMKFICILLFLLLECLTIIAARQSYINYIMRARKILKGE